MVLKEFFESAEQEYYYLLEELLVMSGELHIMCSQQKVKLFVIIFSENSNLYDSGNSLPAIPASFPLP